MYTPLYQTLAWWLKGNKYNDTHFELWIMFTFWGGCPQMMLQCQSGHNQGRPIWVNYIYHYWLIMIMITMRIMIRRHPLSVHQASTGAGIHATAPTFVRRLPMMMTKCISKSMELTLTWYLQCLIKLSWIRYVVSWSNVVNQWLNLQEDVRVKINAPLISKLSETIPIEVITENTGESPKEVNVIVARSHKYTITEGTNYKLTIPADTKR